MRHIIPKVVGYFSLLLIAAFCITPAGECAAGTAAAADTLRQPPSDFSQLPSIFNYELFPGATGKPPFIRYRLLDPHHQMDLRMLYQNQGTGKRPAVDLGISYRNPYQHGQLGYGIDYRESSLYLPENVKAWVDYKMGRDPYLPLLTPLTVGFMLYSVANYARTLYQDRETAGKPAVAVSGEELKVMRILWQEYPLTLPDWYNAYAGTFSDSVVTLRYFQRVVQQMEKKSLLRTRTFEEQGTKYYPAVDSTQVTFKVVP